MLLKFKRQGDVGLFQIFFFLSSFQGKKVSTHLKVVLLQKFKSLEGMRKEGEGTWKMKT